MKWSQVVFLGEEISRNLKSNSSATSDMLYLGLKGPSLSSYKRMVEDLKRKAMKELNLPEEEIVVRSLRPTDLGLATPAWSFNIATTVWNTMVNTTVADNRFIGINGIVYLETSAQSISELKITRMGKVSSYWNIEGLILCENPYMFVDNPVIADQNTNITIEGYGIGTNTAEKMGFMGAVAEKRGLLINP